MSKENSDFFALRSALKREQRRSRELIEALEEEKNKNALLMSELDSQKSSVGELENRLSESDSVAKRQIEELNSARKEVGELKKEMEYACGDGLWELVVNNEHIRKRVICEYLAALPKGVSLLNSEGYAALTPVHRPKDLADAKRIAEKIIKHR